MNFFDKIIEIIAWIKILISPLLFGIVIGLVIWFNFENIVFKFIAILISCLGLFIGIYFAEKIRKKSGTQEFLSTIYSSPDLDNLNTSKNSIPRRPLTTESTEILSKTLTKALSIILETSCPCHYPRYRHLVSFQHDNYKTGPVFCADSNYLASLSCKEDLNFLKLTSRISENTIGDFDDLIYTCTKCETVYKFIHKQYSINFQFQYLIVIDAKYKKDIGEEIAFPIPLFQGLFGFKDEDILTCSKEFELGTSEQLLYYLIREQ